MGISQIDISLALHAEGRDAMARDLRQQRAGDALYPKGEAHMLQWGKMLHLNQSCDKGALVFLGYAIYKLLQIGRGITNLRSHGHGLFWIGRVVQKFHMLCFLHTPPKEAGRPQRTARNCHQVLLVPEASVELACSPSVSAFRVSLPTMPSTSMAAAVWSSFTAAAVLGP